MAMQLLRVFSVPSFLDFRCPQQFLISASNQTLLGSRLVLQCFCCFYAFQLRRGSSCLGKNDMFIHKQIAHDRDQTRPGQSSGRHPDLAFPAIIHPMSQAILAGKVEKLGPLKLGGSRRAGTPRSM